MSQQPLARDLRADYDDLSATGFAVSRRVSPRVQTLLRTCGVLERRVAARPADGQRRSEG